MIDNGTFDRLLACQLYFNEKLFIHIYVSYIYQAIDKYHQIIISLSGNSAVQSSRPLSFLCHKYLIPGDFLLLLLKSHLLVKMMVAMAFVFTSNTFVRSMQNLSHQTLKSKQGLFSIFLGIFAFETLKLLLGTKTWLFLKLIWKTFVSLLKIGIPSSKKRLKFG